MLSQEIFFNLIKLTEKAMTTINTSKDVSKAIEDVLFQLRDKNKCPNLDNSCITKLQNAKKWIDQSNLEEALQVLLSAYKQFAQAVLNNLINRLDQGSIDLDDFLLELTISTMEMDAYCVPQYSEILKEVMKNLLPDQREYAKNYYKKMLNKPDEVRNRFEHHSQKAIDPDIFNMSVQSLWNAADRGTSRYHH